MTFKIRVGQAADFEVPGSKIQVKVSYRSQEVMLQKNFVIDSWHLAAGMISQHGYIFCLKDIMYTYKEKIIESYSV